MKNKHGIPLFKPKPKKVRVKYMILRRKTHEIIETIVTPYSKSYAEELKKEGWTLTDSFRNTEVEVLKNA